MRKDGGMILLISLILALLGLIIIGTLTQLLSFTTRFSGSLKRYTIAVEAVRGAIEDFRRDAEVAWESGREGDFVGNWKRWAVVDSVFSPSGEKDFVLDPPKTAKQVISNCNWSKFYGEYEACVEVVAVKSGKGEKGVNRIPKWLLIDVVAYKEGTSERAWYSVALHIIGEK